MAMHTTHFRSSSSIKGSYPFISKLYSFCFMNLNLFDCCACRIQYLTFLQFLHFSTCTIGNMANILLITL